MAMQVWRRSGRVFVKGLEPGTPMARDLGTRLGAQVHYHQKWRRWTLPLHPQVIETLFAIGLPLDADLRAWHQEQQALATKRAQANGFKTCDVVELRARLAAAGVRSKRELRDHQVRAVAYALKLPACGLFLDTGTGKTAVAAVTMQALVDRDPQKRFLVVAPKSILVVGWGRDLDSFSWLPWVNLSDPPARVAVNTCPVCGRRFKAHVSWAHVRTHMARYRREKGEEAA